MTPSAEHARTKAATSDQPHEREKVMDPPSGYILPRAYRAPSRTKVAYFHFLQIIDYENRSPWFPGSVVFGTGVGEGKAVAISGGTTGRDSGTARARANLGDGSNGLHHRRQNQLPPVCNRQADLQADGSAPRDPDLRLRRSVEASADDTRHRRRTHGFLR